MSTSMYEVFHWDTEPSSKPRLSLAPNPDPLLSNIDDPSSGPLNPHLSKSFHISHAGELKI